MGANSRELKTVSNMLDSEKFYTKTKNSPIRESVLSLISNKQGGTSSGRATQRL